MNQFIAFVVVLAIAGFAIWLAQLRARAQGAAEQAEKDAQIAKEAEEAIHQVQAESRDATETEDRLRKGTF